MKEKLLKSTLVVSLMTFLSRILGFVRDIVIARLLGAGMGADVFFVAFKIPNFLRRLFAEGAFSQAFIPVLAEYRERGDQDLKQLIAATSGTLAGVLFFITLIGVIAAPIIILIFAPGFIDQPEKLQLARELLRITFPYILFVSLTALASSILNSFGKFAVPAFTPVFLNISMIGCALWLAPHLDEPVKALAWGVFIGGVVQLLFQMPFLMKIGSLPKPHWGWKDEGVQKILRLMIPAMFGVSVSQINLLLDTLLASFLITGSISWLYYSDRLVEFPLGILGIALATVILPNLSKKHATASMQEFSHTIDWALRWVFLIGTPAAIGLIILAEPLLLTLFQYGEFTPNDAHQASLSLMAYGLGLLPFIFIKVLAPGFYARQDTKTPVKIGIIAMISNMGLNIVLMIYLAHVGLALATALSAMLNAGLLYYTLRKKAVYQPIAGWGLFFVRMLLANIVLVAFLLWVTPINGDWISWSGWHRFGILMGLITTSAIVYFAVLTLCGVRLKTLVTPQSQE
ncbi:MULTISPECIES: murein biosynthesis integral membrane protein MurJ [unclassified Methylophaga]|jgi:putative peptidoglycan lipid II flippase|uniref:murein biosynthesis integral membrane protein MurJ n=7 Tax=Methylophaga TaxID=40222 RepID=UPI000C688683|nr:MULTISPECIES: murein biosynthesis integral membrane protein MurJ [unclassified Methylophaga]MAL48643.1 murein biosynthesis integral membrane protein MurJ [Methylophaga sp.]MBP24937.1 murein biosynthesis integral membrane protein MurJ [Methylophaga sp.]HCC82455.1 murein biosynthesis integral membrane protein MurJ [Methylophaga sp.]|tara:strand:+ start:11854 stop:13398 length:1545 start_codon:yes stop_codon:yes gene_type:complete